MYIVKREPTDLFTVDKTDFSIRFHDCQEAIESQPYHRDFLLSGKIIENQFKDLYLDLSFIGRDYVNFIIPPFAYRNFFMQHYLDKNPEKWIHCLHYTLHKQLQFFNTHHDVMVVKWLVSDLITDCLGVTKTSLSKNCPLVFAELEKYNFYEATDNKHNHISVFYNEAHYNRYVAKQRAAERLGETNA